MRSPVRPNLTAIGELVEMEINIIPTKYEDITIDKYVIMPNHIHMIIVNSGDGRPQVAPTVSRVVKQFKGSIAKKVGFSIWQKSFHDRIIRNETEYRQIWQYIDENPIKWDEDKYNDLSTSIQLPNKKLQRGQKARV